MMLVTAAAGNQGRLLIPKLRAAGVKVRALRQTPGKDEELKALGASEVITGDSADRSVLRQALKGVETVYQIGPSAHPLEREMGFAMVDVAKEMGVKHLIFNSVLHARASKIIQHKYKRDIEEHIIESGLNFTILQPSDYMLPHLMFMAFEHGVFELCWDLDRVQAMIDLHDLTDVIAKVAREGERHFFATYELTSPGNHSARDIGATIAKVTGKKIEVKEVTPETMLDRFYGGEDLAEKFKHQIAVFRSFSLWYDQHDFLGNPNVLAWVLGREPTTLVQFVSREWQAWKAAQQRAAI